MLNRTASLAMSTSVLKALPGKLDIKRHSPSILYILGNSADSDEMQHHAAFPLKCYIISFWSSLFARVVLRPKLKFYLFSLTPPTLKKKPLLKKILFQFSVKIFFLYFIANLENCPM